MITDGVLSSDDQGVCRKNERKGRNKGAAARLERDRQRCRCGDATERSLAILCYKAGSIAQTTNNLIDLN